MSASRGFSEKHINTGCLQIGGDQIMICLTSYLAHEDHHHPIGSVEYKLLSICVCEASYPLGIVDAPDDLTFKEKLLSHNKPNYQHF